MIFSTATSADSRSVTETSCGHRKSSGVAAVAPELAIKDHAHGLAALPDPSKPAYAPNTRVATSLSRRMPVTPEPERTLQHPQQAAPPDLDSVMYRVAAGDQDAFAILYDAIAPRAYGLIRRIVRDPALAEEVTQDALVEVWRTAYRFDKERGSAVGWILAIAHHRAVDRVRAEEAAADRERRAGTASVPFDEVIAEVTARLEQHAVRRCLRALTAIQREAILLAYYGGLTYRDVAERLGAALPTIKTRMRDGLIRLRDCLGVTLG